MSREQDTDGRSVEADRIDEYTIKRKPLGIPIRYVVAGLLIGLVMGYVAEKIVESGAIPL